MLAASDSTYSQAELREFFALFEGAFEKAVSQAGEVCQADFLLAGGVFRLQAAGNAFLAKIRPAIAHLELPEQADRVPHLTIQLWDSRTTGSPLPLLLRELTRSFGMSWYAHCGPRGDLLRFNNPPCYAAFHPGPNILSVYDSERRLGLFWREDAASLPYFERGSPLRTILNWWLSEQGCQLVHAGAVGRAAKAALLVGKGGSGKSTASLACLQAGMSYLGDDYCLVSFNGGPVVHSLYTTAKLVGGDDLERFPALKEHFQPGADGEKALVFVHEHFPDQVERSMPVAALCILEINHTGETRLLPATPASALMALAPSTIVQLPGAGDGAMRSLGRLVHAVPCYRLSLGTRIEQIPAVIDTLLEANF